MKPITPNPREAVHVSPVDITPVDNKERDKNLTTAEQHYLDLDISHYIDFQFSVITPNPREAIHVTPVDNTPVDNKERGENLTIDEQHYLDLGHSLIEKNRAMSRDIFQFIDHQFSEQKIDEKVDENTLNNDLLSTFAYVDKSLKDHFKEWNLDARFSSSLQPMAWIKLVSGFVNIFGQKNVYECHVAMLGFREFVYQCCDGSEIELKSGC